MIELLSAFVRMTDPRMTQTTPDRVIWVTFFNVYYVNKSHKDKVDHKGNAIQGDKSATCLSDPLKKYIVENANCSSRLDVVQHEFTTFGVQNQILDTGLKIVFNKVQVWNALFAIWPPTGHFGYAENSSGTQIHLCCHSH